MRIKIFAVVVLFSFGILILGLFYTQIFKYSFYTELSENNRIRVLALEAPRGKIFDRKERLLVSNRISFDIEVIFQEIRDKQNIINVLSDILDVDKETLKKRIEESSKRPFVPVKIIEDVEKDKAIQLEEASLDLPGVIVTTRPLRNYIYKDTISHAVGYLGKISEAELRKYKSYGYRMHDFVGKDGLERTYNDYLRGIDGGLQIEVDNKGRQLRVLAIKKPQQGKDIYLTIDIELQEFCKELLSGQRGTIVVMEPSSGAILAMVSHPDFDPNIFVSPNDSDKIDSLLNNSETFPMVNRAISGLYPPGSIFKVVVAASALDSGLFNNEKTFSCQGTYRVGNRTFHCWDEEGHGTQNLEVAIKQSCNVFFYQLGLLVGVDKISEYAFKFGLGRPSGIDLPGETGGFVPTVSWKRKEFKEGWFKGETANYAIGQGFLSVTPIQISRIFSTVANGGRLVKPFIVERIEEVGLQHTEYQKIGLLDKTLEYLKEALKSVVNAPRGTGVYARSNTVLISGKTGTAQNPKGASHAWFAGFAPFENPRVCVGVFIEHGGKGGFEPARFARKIIEEAKKLELL